MQPKNEASELHRQIQVLQDQLAEAQDTLRAIRSGEVDALVVSTPKGDQIFTISGAEKPYRTLIEQMKEGAVMLSDDNSILYCNNGFAKMVKIPLEKIIGSPVNKMVPPTHKGNFEKLLNDSRKAHNAFAEEITLQANDQTLIPTHISANTLQMDSISTTFLVITDLTQHMEEEVHRYTTELEKAQIALWQSEQRWATTLASIGDAVIATDLKCRVTFMNKIAENLTGWTLKEANDKPIGKVFRIINQQTRQEIENPVAKVFKKGIIIGLGNQTILVRRDGKEIPIDDSGAPIKNREGKIAGAVLIFRDISERKQMQTRLETYTKHLEDIVRERTEKLRDTERLAAIGATAGMVGHDIRNPLQTVTGELYLAKKELDSIPKSESKESLLESINIIQEQTAYINKIVSDLQDYARPLIPEIQKTSTKQLIEESLANVKVSPEIRVTNVVAPDAENVNVDRTMMKRVLTNLIINGIQAMPSGGTLTIKAYRNGENTCISIRDTGIGIPQDLKNKMFQPLFTTRSKGQGFGLAVSKRLVDAQKGEISYESSVGKGTTFFVKIPS